MRERIEALGVPPGVWVSTFHAFCARMLRDLRRPRRAGSRPSPSTTPPTPLAAVKRAIGRARKWTPRSSSPPTSRARSAPPRTSSGAAEQLERGRRAGGGRHRRPDLRALRAPARAGQRGGLRRPADPHGPAARATSRRRASASAAASATSSSTSTRTPTTPSTSSPATWPRRTRTSASPATRTSPSTAGAAPTSNNILEFEQRLPQRHASSASSRTIAPPAASSAPPTASSPTTASARRKRSGRRTPKASRVRRAAPARTSRTRRTPSPPTSRGSSRDGRCVPRDIAIFYRVNSQSRVLEDRAARRGHPVPIVAGTRVLPTASEIKDLLAYLRLLDNPADDVGLERVANVPPRRIGDLSLERLQGLGRGARPDAARGAGARPRRPASAARRCKASPTFRRLLEELRALPRRPVAAVVERLLARHGFERYLASADGQRRGAHRERARTGQRRRRVRPGRAGGQPAGLPRTGRARLGHGPLGREARRRDADDAPRGQGPRVPRRSTSSASRTACCRSCARTATTTSRRNGGCSSSA